MNSENSMSTFMDSARVIQSLEELRTAHRSLHRFSKTPGIERSQILHEIQAFLQNGVQLGEQLDLPADRDHAQGMLDYWASLRETEYREPSEMQRLSSVQDAVLLPFNREAAKALVEEAERVLERLSSKDRELACRILVRMTHLDPKNRTITVGKESVDALRRMGETSNVDSLLKSLEGAGVLKRSGEAGSEQMTLSHESLIRRWTPLSEALAQRLRFREAAEFWEAHNRDTAALLSSGALLDEAIGYRDMGDLEREFADASWSKHNLAQSRRFQFLSAAAVVLSVGVLLLAGLSVLVYSKNAQLEISNGELKVQTSEAKKQTALAEQEKKRADDEAAKVKKINTQLTLANDAISRANLSLVTKQKLSVVVEIARALAEIGANNHSADREISRKRLHLLVSEYPQISKVASEKFSTTLDKLQAGAESSNERTALQVQILNYGRQLKAEALNGTNGNAVDNEVLKTVAAERDVAFDMVRYCTSQIVSICEQHKPFREADQFIVEFWKLYWADLAFVEQQRVEIAMAAFGRSLNEIDHKLLEEAPTSVKTSPSFIKGNRDQLTARQFAQTLMIDSPDELKPQIEILNKQVLDADDVLRLRQLADELSVALKEEQNAPLELETPLSEL